MSLNLDFEDLRRRVRRLQNAKVDRSLELAELEALTEGAFRLALHPSTPNDERVALLALAHLHAPTHPKFSYHLGLLYLKRGDLDRAASWLASAVRKVPNSHRVWVHISLLQSELDARFAAQPEYEKGALRELSSEVKGRVREGADRFPADLMRFRPPRSAAQPGHGRRPHEALEAPEAATPDAPVAGPLPYTRRFVGEGCCRWPSVYRLTLEDALQAEYSYRSLERALPLMEHIVRTAAGRRGGASAFAVAAIQWLSAGYPHDEVGRWRDSVAAAEESPALALVDRALDLYRAPVEELPERLRRALEDGAVPVYVAALIHYQRLMAPALPELRELAAFRLARAAVRSPQPAAAEPVDEEELADLRRKLARALERLRRDPRQAARAARRPPPGTGGGATASGHDLEADAALLTDANEQVSARARELMTSACRDDLAGPELERLIVDGRQLIRVHGEMRELARILSRECDAHLVATSNGAGGAGSTATGGFLREALNRVCYSSLRYLEDEIELRAASVGSRRGPETPADPIVRSIENSIAALRRARTEGEGSTVAAAGVFLEAERIGPRLIGLQGRLFDELKAARSEAKAGGTADGTSTLRRRVAQLADAVESCARGSAESLERLADAAGRLSELSEDAVEEQVGTGYPARREETQKRFAELGALGRFKRVLQQIERALESAPKGGSAPAAAPAAEAEPIGAEIGRLLARLGGEAPPDDAGSETAGASDLPMPRDADPAATAPEAPVADLSREEDAAAPPRDGSVNGASAPEEESLAEILEGIVAALTEAFARCRQTLEASLGSHRGDPEIRALAATLDSRAAETFHRLGLRRRARRIWQRMSRGRPADLGLLRNIAVCASYESDPALALTAWRRCLEALYYYDAVLGKPNLLAPERQRFHEAIGLALLPQALPAFLLDRADVEADERSRASLIERHEQMRELVGHMSLKFFNLKVDFGSPLLFLGVDRGESPEVRVAAAGKLGAWCDRLAVELDWPVFGLYLDRVRDHLGDQLEICRDPANLTHSRDRRFQVEKGRQLEWVMEACRLKLRLRNLLLAGDQAHLDYVSWPATIRFIDEMVRLDELPVDLSPSFLGDTALKLGMTPGQLVDAARTTGALLIHQKFGRRPLTEQEDLTEPLYRRMLEAWSSSRLVGMEDPEPGYFGYRRFETFLDDPSPLYHPEAQRIAQEAADYTPAIDFLLSWGRRHPGITGPQRQAAQLLAKNDRSKRAAEVLSSALEAARLPAGRAECRRLLKTLRAHEHIEAEQFGEALPTLRERVEEDREGTVATLAQYLKNFARHALERQEDPGHEEMMATVKSWLDRFRETLGARDVRQILQRRDQALIVAFTAHLGDIEQDGVDPRSTREALSRLIDAYPDVIDAYAWRMQASFEVAERERERGRESSALKALAWVRKDAEHVQKGTPDDNRRQLAERYLRDAERLSAG